MESAFFELWDNAINVCPFLYFDFGYSKISGYALAMSSEPKISQRWTNAFYKGNETNRKELFAKAYSALCDYLNENCGGY